jgi:transcriptional regulator with XRE-family HTH domain
MNVWGDCVSLLYESPWFLQRRSTIIAADANPHAVSKESRSGQIMSVSESRAKSSYLGEFLRILRLRLNKHVRALGSLERLPSKVGRRVTQEEIAEVVGVSRGWYRMLESDNTIRPSRRLLVRLADALTLSVFEQAHLFHLAFPELAVPETTCRLCNDAFLTTTRPELGTRYSKNEGFFSDVA